MRQKRDEPIEQPGAALPEQARQKRDEPVEQVDAALSEQARQKRDEPVGQVQQLDAVLALVELARNWLRRSATRWFSPSRFVYA